MATPTSYGYTATVNPERLTPAIQTSSISVALDHMDVFGTSVTIYFKDALSAGDKTTLDGLVANTPSTPVQANMYVQFQNLFRVCTGNATTTVKSSTGILHMILVNNNNTGGTVSLYDSLSGSGTLIASLQIGTPAGGLLSTTGLQIPYSTGILGISFSTGLTVVTAGSANNNITIIYQ